MKCMKNEEKKRYRSLTKGFRLGRGQILDEKKDFWEKEVFGSREKRERDWNVWVRGESSRISSIYRIKYLDISRRYWRQKSSIDRGGIELLSTRQRVQKNSSMDRAIYREVSRETQKTWIVEACVKRYRASIKLLLSI